MSASFNTSSTGDPSPSAVEAGAGSQSVVPSHTASTSTLSRCQSIIKQHLTIESAASCDVFPLLKQIEQQEQVSKVTGVALRAAADALGCSTASCFDVAGWPLASWTSHSLCERCKGISLLLQVVDKDSMVGRSATGGALVCTQCVSERQRTGSLKHLPFELVEEVILYTIASFKSSDPNTAYVLSADASPKLIQSLLHTSSVVRRLVKRHLPPAVCRCLPKTASEARKPKHTLHWVSSTFWTFARKAVRWYLLDSVERQRQPLVLPDCSDNIRNARTEYRIKLDVHVLDKDGPMPFSWRLTLKQRYGSAERYIAPPQSSVAAVSSAATATSSASVEPSVNASVTGNTGADVDALATDRPTRPACLTVRDACEVLVQALDQALPVAPREADLYYRAILWDRQTTDSEPAQVAIKLSFLMANGQPLHMPVVCVMGGRHALPTWSKLN